MKERTYNLPKRLLALVLSLVMVLHLMPVLSIGTEAAGISTDPKDIVADPSTMDEWKEIFLPNGLPSTDYAGSVWTDKTVLTAGSNLPGGVTIGKDNFLVALSALGTNSVVVGQGSVPTDTVFVLDVSNSMDAQELTDMVNAANNAIRTLMANPGNRVSVIVFDDSAQVVLPLDHYTGATAGNITTPTFLTYSGSTIYAGACVRSNRVTTHNGVIGSNGEYKGSARIGGGTYIQSGLWAAWDQFNAVDEAYITENKTVPAIILMGDGAPSYASEQFAAADSQPEGDGYTNDINEGGGFVSMLSAATIKAKVEEKYGKCYMYTVGFGLESATAKAIATKILNPLSVHQDLDKMWSDYNALSVGSSMTVKVCDRDRAVTKIDTVLDPNYVDVFLEADDAETLNEAFQNIVNDIALQAGYHPTRTDDNGTNYSGYITFSDTLGSGMEVEAMKGILLGGQLHTGLEMARAILDPTSPNWVGTATDPTPMGDEFVRAVKERMGITGATLEEANQKAWALIESAYKNQHLSYDADTGAFSNFIVWYGDADGTYLGPYGDGKTVPEGAVFLNYCYGMLGATEATGQKSDLMYVTVQMSRNLQTDDRVVTFRIPASMLPVLTYKVNVELDDNDQIVEDSATISVNDASPIVLLYEVGVDEELVNPLTVKDYGTLVTDTNSPDYGKYYLYASAWDTTTDKSQLANTRTNSMTYSHFEPSPENEHYFVAENKLLYKEDGTLYTGDTKPTGQVYFQDVIYTATGTPTEGEYKATVTTKLVEVHTTDLANAVQTQGNNTWYMPEGAMYANTYDYDLAKTENNGTNATSTHDYAHYGLFTAVANRATGHDYMLMYQGNNGRLAYEPAQGISLTKTLAQGAVGLDNETFSFTVTVTDDSDNQVTVTNGSVETKDLVDNSLTVTLKAGETVYITGIDTNAQYTVTENITDDNSYRYEVILVNGVTAQTATGNVGAYAITPVEFTNDSIDYGAFTVTKRVTYNNGAAAVVDSLATFTVDITLDGYANRNILVNGNEKITDNDGKITVTIKDGQTITISQVPVGTNYTVVEQTTGDPTGYTMPAGYEFDSYTDTDNSNDGKGTVAATTTGVIINNSYTPTKVDPQANITVKGTKYLRAANSTTALTDWNTLTFNIKLQYWDASRGDLPENNKWVDVATKTVECADPSYEFSLKQDFTAVGNYMFRIIEDNIAITGVTYDVTRNLFRVRVTDTDLDGQLEIAGVENVQDTTVTPGTPGTNTWTVEADFNNIFDAVNATWTPSAVKTLEGRELIAGEFAFQLEQVSGTQTNGQGGTRSVPMPKDATGQTVTQVLSGKGGNILFPAIAYTSEDVGYTFVYKLVEVEPAVKVPGVTYDKTVWIAEVVVDWTEESSNVVGTTVTFHKENEVTTAPAMTFHNIYKAASVAAGPFYANKTLTNLTPGATGNMAMADGQFEFLLKAQDGAPMPADAPNGKLYNIADGKITIPAITYTEAGTYTYTLEEVTGTAKGYTYDAQQYLVTVVVTDPGDGKLVVSSTTFERIKTDAEGDNTPVNSMVFANTYKADPTGEITLGGNKTLNGRDLNAGEFSFNITGNGISETVTNRVDGSFAFPAMTFDRVGTYTYTVTEVLGSLGGVRYDPKSYALEITVRDNGNGQLVATATLDGDTVTDLSKIFTFTNTYTAAPTSKTFTAKKTLEGRDLKAGEFSFTLSGEGINETVKNDAHGNVHFSAITYTAAGEYTYTVTEVKGSLGGVTYDEKTYTIVVIVIDDGNGALVVSKTTVNGTENGSLNFINTYKAANVVLAAGTIHADKTLTNVTAGVTNTNMTVEADAFQFQLKPITTSAPMPEGSVDGVYKLGNADGGAISIPAITYTATGTYVYELTELADRIPAHITRDPAVYTVTVTVSDPGDGQLKAEVAYAKGDQTVTANELVFTNTYKASSATLTIHGHKNLKDRPAEYPLEADEFSFTLKGLNGAPMPTTAVDGKVTVQNDEDGKFSFADLTFTAAGEYQYTVTEVHAGDTIDGVKYDTTVYTITVVVTDNLDGQLVASITSTHGTSENPATFTNTYTAAPVTGVVIEAEKLLTDITSGVNQAMTPVSGDFSFVLTDSDGKVVETVKNVGGKITFSPLTFEEVGTYTYTVAEVKGNQAGIGYDDTVITATVTVTDDSNGQLVAKVTYDKTPQFKNTHKAADATVTLAGQKTLDGGRDLKDGEFSFNLKGNGIDVTVKNNADGKFAFPVLTFDQVGTYTYEITEVRGDDKQVAYDPAKYTVTVTVTYENGVMTAKATVDGKAVDSYGFTNIFTPDAITVDVEVQKILQNLTKQEMGLSGFQFHMVGEGREMTVASDAEGIAKFTLTFDKTGTYVFKFNEVKGAVEGMTYDDSIQEIKIVVTQDAATGELKATVEGQVSFTNTLAELPPRTGDDFNLSGMLLMMSLSLVCMMAVLVLGKKQLF